MHFMRNMNYSFIKLSLTRMGESVSVMLQKNCAKISNLNITVGKINKVNS